ncbi:MAG: hypothetical protein WD045_15575 [Pirellulaceae bacterium]
MPTPYETLIEAATQLDDSDAEVEDPEQLTEAELAAILGPNWPAFEQARASLRDKPRVTIRYEASYYEDRRKDLQPCRILARYLGFASLLAKLRGDFAEAARLGLDNLELAHTMGSAGLIVDYLVGEAFAGVGTDSLRKIRNRLDESTRRMVIDRVIAWEAERWPAEEIIAHDAHWMEISGYVDPPDDSDHSDFWDDETLSEEDRAMLRDIDETVSELAKQPSEVLNPMYLHVETRALAMLRMLAIDLALRSCRDANGEYPERLTVLETILPEGLPLDPYTAVPFIYRREADAFQLYSPGPSGVDHGGTFGFWPAIDSGLSDFCLDARDYAEVEFSMCVPTPRPGFVARSVKTIRGWWKS